MNETVLASQPLYRQVMVKILQQLAAGVLKPGQALPSEWDLARQWQVSQGTVRKGLNELVAQGVLTRQQGVGTFVTGKNAEWGDYPLIDGALARPGAAQVWPRSELLSIVPAQADDETAAQLHLRVRDAVWRLLVLWRQGHRTVAVDEVMLPTAPLADLNILYVQQRVTLYALLQLHYGVALYTQLQLMSVHQGVAADVARLLKTEAQAPVWYWCRLSCATDGAPMEWRRRYLAAEGVLLQTSGPSL
ncbi:GntR family transcriptional regulator [Neisseria sp. HSC-16F19]|nr:GntR family transcriptional regulator [Neisseria sp. HSC-16F19]MCP2040926.1 GntR family transcriptional regulator [Neisseria sp. HSC-16F19]